MESLGFLLAIGALIIIGLGGYKLSQRTGIFDVLIYLGIGILFGNLLNVSASAYPEITDVILNLSLAFILFYGGYSLSVFFLKRNLKLILILVTLGILMTAGIIGYAVNALLQWPIFYGLLFGSLISANDPAVLIPLLGRFHVKREVETLLISESGYNDATAGALTSALIGTVSIGALSLGGVVTDFLYQSAVGIGVGAVTGFFWSVLGRKFRIRHFIFTLPILIMSAYGITYFAGGSSFMGAITAGLFLKIGQEKFATDYPTDKSKKMLSFLNRTSILGRIAVFIMLGATVSFSEIGTIGIAGLMVIFILMFVARPVTVIVSYLLGLLAKSRTWGWREIGFLCWTGNVRGVMPTTLAVIIITRGIAYGHAIAGLTFLAVLLTIVIQAATTPILIKRWNLSQEDG